MIVRRVYAYHEAQSQRLILSAQDNPCSACVVGCAKSSSGMEPKGTPGELQLDASLLNLLTLKLFGLPLLAVSSAVWLLQGVSATVTLLGVTGVLGVALGCSAWLARRSVPNLAKALKGFPAAPNIGGPSQAIRSAEDGKTGSLESDRRAIVAKYKRGLDDE